MTKISWISTIRDGGNVQRFHTTNLIKSQDVAQHSFSCALLAEHFGQMINDVDPRKVMLHMLIHDIPETGIGDTPYQVKRTNPALHHELKQSEEDWAMKHMPHRIYKNMYYEDFTRNEIELCVFVDQFEALLKAKEEIGMGNKSLKPMLEAMFNVCYGIIIKNPDFDCLCEVIGEIDQETYYVSE